MASCCRRYRSRRLQALDYNPKLLVIRPTPSSTRLNHLKPLDLSAVLIAVHKDSYAAIKLTQQGGPRRRETFLLTDLHVLCRILAPLGHGAMSELSPLSGAKRTICTRSEYFAF